MTDIKLQIQEAQSTLCRQMPKKTIHRHILLKEEFRTYDVSFFMSIESENLLKKFLIFKPNEKSILEKIMRDSWINMGPEKEPEPCVYPLPDCQDPRQTQYCPWATRGERAVTH